MKLEAVPTPPCLASLMIWSRRWRTSIARYRGGDRLLTLDKSHGLAPQHPDVDRAMLIRGFLPDTFSQGMPEAIGLLHIDLTPLALRSPCSNII